MVHLRKNGIDLWFSDVNPSHVSNQKPMVGIHLVHIQSQHLSKIFEIWFLSFPQQLLRHTKFCFLNENSLGSKSSHWTISHFHRRCRRYMYSFDMEFLLYNLLHPSSFALNNFKILDQNWPTSIISITSLDRKLTTWCPMPLGENQISRRIFIKTRSNLQIEIKNVGRIVVQ